MCDTMSCDFKISSNQLSCIFEFKWFFKGCLFANQIVLKINPVLMTDSVAPTQHKHNSNKKTVLHQAYLFLMFLSIKIVLLYGCTAASTVNA